MTWLRLFTFADGDVCKGGQSPGRACPHEGTTEHKCAHVDGRSLSWAPEHGRDWVAGGRPRGAEEEEEVLTIPNPLLSAWPQGLTDPRKEHLGSKRERQLHFPPQEAGRF